MDYLVGGIPLLLLVFGLVEFSKKLGLKGKGLTISSMVIRIVSGLIYQVYLAVPVSFNGWVQAGAFGLLIGLVASGIYDFANKRLPKTKS